MDQHHIFPEDILSRILKELNSQQEEAVTYLGGPLLVLAGAGSGKTRVITRRIAYILENENVKPHEILAVTFTNKAAREMEERVQTLIGKKLPWTGTFHSVCVRILRIELPKVGRDGNFTIVDASDQLSLVKECIKELNIDDKEFPARMIKRGISVAKNHLKTAEDFADEAHGKKPEAISLVYTLYQEKLKNNRAMDFDDLIFETIRLFKKHKDILEKYQQKFKYILIDEYQDVNQAQYTFAKLLSKGHNNLCVVGDDDQAIYGFRGADVSIILRFEKDFHGAKVVKLEESYRSSKLVLDAAHAIVKKIKGRKKKKLFSQHKTLERIGSNACVNGREEARFVVKEINKWMAKNRRFRDFAVLYRTNSQSRAFEEVLNQEGIPTEIIGGVRFYSRAEIKDAVAYLRLLTNPWDYLSFRRIINTPSRGIGNITQEKIINYSMEHKKSLLEVMKSASDLPRIGRKIQKTLSSFSSMISRLQRDKEESEKDVEEKLFIRRVMNDVLKAEKKSKLTVADFIDKIPAKMKNEKDLVTDFVKDVLGTDGASKTKLSEFEDTFLLTLSSFIRKVLIEVKYFRMLKSDPDPKNLERLDNLEELLSHSAEFENSSDTKTLDAFLEHISLVADIDEKSDPEAMEQGRVTLMTVHSAKGLEFPIVFIVGLEEGLFPHVRAIETGTDSAIDEERRLFYVAMTRTIDKVYLTYARERTIHGKPHNQSPSRFLREVPEELIDKYMPEVSKRSFTRKIPSVLDKSRIKKKRKTSKFHEEEYVHHKIFGKGKVLSTSKGYVTADFGKKYGQKTLSQDYLTAYGEGITGLNAGDKVKLLGGLVGVLKKKEGDYAYVILPNGDTEKVRIGLLKAVEE